MSDNYEGASEAEDIIFSTASEVPELWEWDSELSELDLSVELNLSDISIVEDHIDLRAWEDFNEADQETEKEIESYRQGSDDDKV
jgi:hypothetical protein